MSESQRGRSSVGKRKSYYNRVDQRKRKPKLILEPGLKGFICTCNFNEKHCVREAYNILNEYSDSLEKNNSALPEESVEEEDIDEALAKEVKALQQEASPDNMNRKFQVVDTGSNNCIFIRTTVPDPVGLVVHVMEDIRSKKQQKARFLLRMLPIETTCKAHLRNMEEDFKPLVEKHFSSEGKTFSILFRARCNNSVTRDAVIESFAGMVKNAHPNNRADLNNPQLAVLVEIIKGVCCIGVVPHFTEFRKYNLLELAAPSSKEKAEVAKECSVSVTGEKSEVDEEVTDEKPQVDEEVTDEKPHVDEEATDEKPQVDEEAMDEKPQVDEEAMDEKPQVDEEVMDEKPHVDEEVMDEKPHVDEEVMDEKPQVDEEAMNEKPKVNAEVESLLEKTNGIHKDN